MLFVVRFFLGFLERAVKYFRWFRRKVLYSAFLVEVTDSQIELEEFLDCLKHHKHKQKHIKLLLDIFFWHLFRIDVTY